MKENADKHLDSLSRKVIGKSSIESPSFEFTQTVMSQIKALSHSKVTTYVPLISKRVWTLIGLGFGAVVAYSIFKDPVSESSWLTDLNLGELPSYEFVNPLASLDMSQTTMYAFLLLALMLCIQIPLLKHFFNKRLE